MFSTENGELKKVSEPNKGNIQQFFSGNNLTMNSVLIR